MNSLPQHNQAPDLQRAQLETLRQVILESHALHAKTAIQGIATDLLNQDCANPYALPGDDCAAFPVANGYQLLAMEGMLPAFVEDTPWHAGWSAVMANVSDIAAMGGRATAVVNAFWHTNPVEAAQVISGMKDACDTFGIALAGGHTNIQQQNRPGLAVAIMGFATHLLSSLHVKPGQQIYMVCDLSGEWHRDKPYWSVIPGKSREQIRQMWERLPVLAENGLVSAAKDISNAGVMGTLLMLLEMNGLGADIALDEIPRPLDDSDWLRWLMAFQSYGYLLTGEEKHADAVAETFQQHGLTCRPIGSVSHCSKVNLALGDAQIEFWDFSKDPVTGLSLRRS